MAQNTVVRQKATFRQSDDELYLAPIGLRLKYSVPKRQKDQELAQGPATTEQVLVVMAGK